MDDRGSNLSINVSSISESVFGNETTTSSTSLMETGNDNGEIKQTVSRGRRIRNSISGFVSKIVSPTSPDADPYSIDMQQQGGRVVRRRRGSLVDTAGELGLVAKTSNTHHSMMKKSPTTPKSPKSPKSVLSFRSANSGATPNIGPETPTTPKPPGEGPPDKNMMFHHAVRKFSTTDAADQQHTLLTRGTSGIQLQKNVSGNWTRKPSGFLQSLHGMSMDSIAYGNSDGVLMRDKMIEKTRKEFQNKKTLLAQINSDTGLYVDKAKTTNFKNTGSGMFLMGGTFTSMKMHGRGGKSGFRRPQNSLGSLTNQETMKNAGEQRNLSRLTKRLQAREHLHEKKDLARNAISTVEPTRVHYKDIGRINCTPKQHEKRRRKMQKAKERKRAAAKTTSKLARTMTFVSQTSSNSNERIRGGATSSFRKVSSINSTTQSGKLGSPLSSNVDGGSSFFFATSELN